MLPPDMADDTAMNTRAELVEEIDTWPRVSGNSPDDADIADMLRRHVPTSYLHSAAPGQPSGNSQSQSHKRDCYAECAHLTCPRHLVT